MFTWIQALLRAMIGPHHHTFQGPQLLRDLSQHVDGHYLEHRPCPDGYHTQYAITKCIVPWCRTYTPGANFSLCISEEAELLACSLNEQGYELLLPAQLQLPEREPQQHAYR